MEVDLQFEVVVFMKMSAFDGKNVCKQKQNGIPDIVATIKKSFHNKNCNDLIFTISTYSIYLQQFWNLNPFI